MRIACIDSNASAKVNLQRRFDKAFESCRESVGHIAAASPYPASKEEVVLSNSPDIIALGSELSIEESFSFARELRSAFPRTPILVFLQPKYYSLRALRRFENYADEVLSTEDKDIRLVHLISTLDVSRKKQVDGKLVFVTGVKGGVGTTSIVSGLAHAAEAVGLSAVVLDLSVQGALVQYMASQRWQSPDYAAALSDSLTPDDALLDKLLTTAPNGINLLLPPSGGSDIRELWLRDAERFEISLGLLDILKERFDVVLVDHASSEGILPFAISSSADSICVVTSNDPASAHLLSGRLFEVTSLPGNSNVQILINNLEANSLTKEDIVDFLYANEQFEDYMSLSEPLTFDPRGKNWIGTGNTFYTESSETNQNLLEDCLQILLLNPDEAEARSSKPGRKLFSGIKRLADRIIKTKANKVSSPKALPFIAPKKDFEENSVEYLAKGDNQLSFTRAEKVRINSKNQESPSFTEGVGSLQINLGQEKEETDSSSLYESPMPVTNDGINEMEKRHEN